MKQTMNETKPSGWQRRTILFLTSQCITLFRSTLVQMAVVWYATMETASGAWVAAFTVCSYLPQFLISFSGGVWADRYSRKLLIAGADALTALATLAMLLAVPHITSKPFFLGGLQFKCCVLPFEAGIQTPAVNAVIPQLVPEEHLMRCNGINAAMQSAVQFAAPAAAGAIFAVSTLDTTLMIDIVTAILGIGLLSYLSIPSCKSQGQCSSFIQDMKAGVNLRLFPPYYRKASDPIWAFYLPVRSCGLPGRDFFVRRSFGDTYWYLTAVEVIGFGGMILGGILISLKNNGQSKTRLLSWGLFSFGAFVLGWTVCLFYSLSYHDVFLWDCFDRGANLHHHAYPGTHRRLHAGPCIRSFGTMYSGFLPLGMALFWSHGRRFPSFLDHDRIRRRSDTYGIIF